MVIEFVTYERWVKRVRAAGMPLVAYLCPNCKLSLNAPLPHAGLGKVSETFMCPACGEIHYRVVAPDGLVTVDGEIGNA